MSNPPTIDIGTSSRPEEPSAHAPTNTQQRAPFELSRPRSNNGDPPGLSLHVIFAGTVGSGRAAANRSLAGRHYALCLTTGAIIHMWVFLDTGVKEL
jgi:hypothetical protein